MKLVDNIKRMSTLSRLARKDGRSIALVPTMGYLHEGHVSLMREARKHADLVIVSIFVNPLQFGPKEDFERYPRDLKRDEKIASEAGVDIIFYPSVKEMYPEGYSTYVNVERMSEGMCGASRPGHFRAVATVVAKLFGITKPDMAYFGQKDAQQAAIVKKMASDLNMGVEIMVMPTVREKDGLAMSSRNTYLSENERRDAAVIYQALKKAESMVASGERDTRRIIKAVNDMIAQKPSVRIEYVSVVDAKELTRLDSVSSDSLIALAACVGKTRLIDNITVKGR